MPQSTNDNFLYCAVGHERVLYIRDYRAESFGVGVGVRVSRDGTVRDQARLFLPGNDEFKGPDDPDGTKGAREWLESHQPKEKGGHNPLLETERNLF